MQTDPDERTDKREPEDEDYRVLEPSSEEAPSVFVPAGETASRGAPATVAEGDLEQPETLPEVRRVWNWSDELWRDLVIAAALVWLGIFVYNYEPIRLLLVVALVAGGLAWAIYKVSVSIERPVRVTPEQALGEYYQALAHHVPSYRRMYLLLTRDAQRAPEFGSFGAFRTYWQYRLGQLRPQGSWWQPIDFQLFNVRTKYTPTRDFAEARGTLHLFIRGWEREPLAKFRFRVNLVKGPDGSWYLDDGRLPEPEANSKPKPRKAQDSSSKGDAPSPKPLPEE